MASSKKIKRELDCILSQEEIAKLAISASEEHDKARALKEEASALEKSAKEKDRQVAEKKTKRMVECVDVKDFARNEIRVERCDEATNWPDGTPVVETRAMTGEERQTMIDVGDNDSAEKVATKAPAKRAAGKRSAAKPN